MVGRTWIAGHGMQDTDCRTQIRTWVAGHGYGHGSKDMDTDMNCTQQQYRINGHAWCLQQKEFKSHRYIVYPV